MTTPTKLTKSMLATLLAMLVATSAIANDPIADKCAVAKLKVASKYAACRLKVDAKAFQRGLAPDYTKCDEKFSQKWDKAEVKAAGNCVTVGDAAAIRETIEAETMSLALGITGTRFVDNGITVLDQGTGLEWAKLVDCGGDPVNCSDDPTFCSAPLCVQNRYVWSDTGSDPDGNVFTLMLPQLNGQVTPAYMPGGGPCFAGHCDWRLPTVDELGALLDCSFPDPCIDPIFGPTMSFPWAYATASTLPSNFPPHWELLLDVTFDPNNAGVGGANGKDVPNFYRPVRGDSCIVDCTGRTCGDDGCGGSCGFCTDLDSSCHVPSGTCVVS